jgi:hypothetical protein
MEQTAIAKGAELPEPHEETVSLRQNAVALASKAVLILGSFLASLTLGLYLQVAYTYTAENFPTRARVSGRRLEQVSG